MKYLFILHFNSTSRSKIIFTYNLINLPSLWLDVHREVGTGISQKAMLLCLIIPNGFKQIDIIK